MQTRVKGMQNYALHRTRFIHVAIFPPFIAALHYANRIGGSEQERQDKVMSAAPRWLQILTGVFFTYALVNFAIFMVLNEGGGAR
jgi:hypothetical protein